MLVSSSLLACLCECKTLIFIRFSLSVSLSITTITTNADDMGLGKVNFLLHYCILVVIIIDSTIHKTLTTISHLFNTTTTQTLQSICLILSNRPDLNEGEPRCTLIVSPVSVIANWDQQIRKFVEPNELKVGIYHGKNRQDVLKQVKKNQLDVVLTSYETLVSDLSQLEQVCYCYIYVFMLLLY